VLHFAEVAYVLGFTQSGLPSAATWHVLVGGAGSNSSAGSELTFSLPNGTYEFQVRVSPTTYEADPASGNVTIDGAGTAVAVRIVPVLYAVIASNSGLPTGSLWFLNLTGGAPFQSTGGTIDMHLTNGTYNYTTATSYSQYAPVHASGTFQVTGGATAFTVAFYKLAPIPPPRWLVTFTETGLPVGTNWGVGVTSVSNGTYAVNVTGNASVTFSLENGSYVWVATTLAPYSPTPALGSLQVNGTSNSIAIVFTSQSSGGSSSSNTTLLVLIGVGVAAIVLVAIVLLLIRRRRG
jgi:hypothetical protein